jgi:DNA mismatch repair protein MutS
MPRNRSKTVLASQRSGAGGATAKNGSGAARNARETPAMRQYYAFKEQHPGCVLFFRMGDFYEMFDEDARQVARALNLTLTERTAGVPMAGVPHHAAESYLRRLIEMGFRVAVCDQIQDPRDAKGVVDRAVTRVVTPGTLIDESLLADHAGSTLAAVCWCDAPGEAGASVSLAAVELSTGAFHIATAPAEEVLDELIRLGVDELLYADTADGEPGPQVARLLNALDIPGSPLPTWQFRQSEAVEQLCAHFGVTTLAGFGLADDDAALRSAGAVLRYLHATQATRPAELEGADAERANEAAQALLRRSLAHIEPPKRRSDGATLKLDGVSLRALEVERTVRAGALEGSLLGVFVSGPASPKTAAGKRLLRAWLTAPSGELSEIERRHAGVATLADAGRTRAELREALAPVADVSRIGARVMLARATPRDVVALGRSLGRLDALAAALDGADAFDAERDELAGMREELTPIAERIASSCVDDAPGHLREGGLFRDGIDAQLDEARAKKSNATEWLAGYQKRLIDEHDLPSLKVGYNRVFGYYIELPSGQANQAPSTFTRKQTLKNAERYITPELKTFEDDVLSAGERAVAREQALFRELCDVVAAVNRTVTRFAEVSARLDALGCFAEHARRFGWARPTMREEPVLRVEQGRHPVLERMLEGAFVANDVCLGMEGAGATGDDDRDDAAGGGTEPCGADVHPRLGLITGPNMSGKSTFIRQTALIVLLAHAGSFVPAAGAVIGLCDRVFTRVGADDALHEGQSTFMVEMIETANILHHATDRSLVVLDEIGRGTSTLDGLSLAWAITEFLAGGEGGVAWRAADESSASGVADGAPARGSLDGGGGPRALFATHYHELTDLAERMPGRIANLHVTVKRWRNAAGEEEIVFLHRIAPGRASESFGVHVARLAGLPIGVLRRAERLLETLSVSHEQMAGEVKRAAEASVSGATRDEGRSGRGQLPLFTEYINHPVVNDLRSLKIDQLSPMEAFDVLRQLVGKASETDA